MSDNIDTFVDEELNDNQTSNNNDNVELQKQHHHHDHPHDPPPHDHHKPIVDRLVRANQDAINQNDDLKLAQYINEHGISSNTEEAFLASTTSSNSSSNKSNITNETNKYNGLSSEEASILLQQYGPNVIPNRQYDTKCTIYMKQLFCSPMPIMIWISIIILLLIHNLLDALILCIIQFINATISFYEINKANDAIRSLQSNLQPTATCKRNNTSFQVIDAAVLVPNDIILLSSGCTVPADCRIIPSSSSSSSSSSLSSSSSNYYIDVDQSSLTGESIPITFYINDTCKMGSVVVRGEVEAIVESTGINTFFGRSAVLVQNNTNNNERTHLQKMLITIMYVLVGISTTLCTISFLYLLQQGEDIIESLSFTIVLLVASIPLAIEIVTTTTLAIGSKTLAKHGAIVTKLSAIEDLAGMSILCSDKTGTLTLNQMILQQNDTPIYDPNETIQSVIVHAALATKWKDPPRDAVDRLILGDDKNNNTVLDREQLNVYEQLDYIPFDPQVKRTESTIRNQQTNEIYKVTKGAPHIILNLLPLTSNQQLIRQQVERDVAKYGDMGIRSLAIARTKSINTTSTKSSSNNNTTTTTNDEWYMIGLITFLDPPRLDTKNTIQETRKYGVQVKMITGDHLLIARNTAIQLDMGDKIFTADRLPLLDPETQSKPPNLSRDYGDLCLIADGFAQVYPEHKYLIVECLRELGYTVGMTGDGVNDAPALKRADIGIAVAGATDAARAASDIVLTEPGLGTISQGIILSRHIFQRMSNFITYRISATLQLLLFFFFAVLFYHPSNYIQPTDPDRGYEWPEFFHMPILMMMLITVLNDGTLITIAYDNAEASQTPNRWNLRALFVVSFVLGGVSCISSLMLLHYLLDSWNPNGLLHKIGIQNVQYGQIITSVYLKVSVSDFLTLFSARTGRYFFWKIKPAPTLLLGGVVALSISSFLAIIWPDTTPDGIPTEGLRNEMELFVFVWVFCLVFWLIHDIAKVVAYKLMYRFNYSNIKGNGVVQLPESARQLLSELEQSSELVGNSRVSSSIV